MYIKKEHSSKEDFMKKVAALLFLLGIAHSVNADDSITLMVCEDCNNDRASELAKSNAPLTQCHTTLSNQKAAIADQTCDSNPHKVIIVDVSGNNHFAFFVGNHSKNGSGKYTKATILNKNDLIAISKQKAIDERFSTFKHTLQTELGLMSFHQISQPSPLDRQKNCPSHINSAVKAVFEEYTSSRIQNWVNHKVEKNIKNPDSFFTSKPIIVGETLYRNLWSEISKNLNLEVNLNNGSDTQYRVIFLAKWIKELGAFSLSVNPYLTYLDGIALNHFKISAPSVSHCLESALDKNLSSSISSYISNTNTEDT